MSAPVVIIGTGLAGYNLAREFRKLDTQTPLLLITADDGRSYSKPLLSTGFAANKNAESLGMATAGRAPLHAEARTEAGLAQADHRVPPADAHLIAAIRRQVHIRHPIR